MPVNRLARARKRAALALAVSALLGTAVTAAGPASATPDQAPEAPAAAPGCSAAYRIEQTLDGGTTWRMCWHYNTLSGLVLDKISYQPKGEPRPIPVLTSARLAQIHVPYDDGESEYDDVTGTDFGQALQNLKPGECPGGTIKTVKVPDTGNVKGLCTTTRARGHAYRLANDEGTKVWQAQGKDLLVYTVNKASWYEYITEWRFGSDGTITSNVGATGSLSPFDYNGGDGRGWPIGKGARAYAESHAHNVFWRLNFGLDGSPKAKVEQYDSKVTAPRGNGTPTTRTTRTAVTKELAGDAKAMRWWRVVSTAGRNKDGHPRSYEIVPGHTDKFSGRPYTRHDVYFTEYKECEQYASNNPGCRDGVPTSVDKWVNGQTLKHPVTWVNIGFHHIARDEDQQPMPVHWQGFSLVPRDVTAMNPLTPADLAGENGQPEEGS
ncbi:copper amine oxidase [Streptomyces sp. PSKA54]|uniref:Amine oxidase n=1 Tax=Streptomyces himalayensis subsp. aureolus TaxID=2758039 RepID=A0A7W2CYP0_9ACTN|nr:copper amine oxidase [Streptomyces himalayensis]MBA4861567.1 copper amine oxidase [Streptomyces himalayensis subsp. aureolus]